jgi:hypothetical protein
VFSLISFVLVPQLCSSKPINNKANRREALNMGVSNREVPGTLVRALLAVNGFLRLTDTASTNGLFTFNRNSDGTSQLTDLHRAVNMLHPLRRSVQQHRATYSDSA